MSTSSFSLSKKGEEFIQKEMKRYESPRSGLIPSLRCVQEEKGWIPPEAVPYLSRLTGFPESDIQELLMFYTLFNKKPVGKLHVQVCCNVSCSLQGGRELLSDLCEFFKVKEGERDPEGTVTLSAVECLGACDEAPVMQVNDDYIVKLKGERAIHFLKDKIEKIKNR